MGVLERVRASVKVLINEPSRIVAFYHDVRRQSLRETAARVSRALFQDEGSRYREWVELYDTISPREADEIRRFLSTLPIQPKFSILVPVYQTPQQELTEMIASVKAQIYDDWELCIADDASKQPHV